MINARSVTTQRSVALAFLVLILLSVIGLQGSTVARALEQGQRLPVVMFGLDAADSSRHTDTLLIAVLDVLENSLGVLSVPRDTRIDLPGYRFNRINEIYGYHFRKTADPFRASNEVLRGLEHVLSGPDLSLHLPYFLQVDYNGFRRVIDIFGGVWIQVRHPMHYDDNAGNYHFHKEPGRHLLKGDEALKYVRFRGATGDRGRIMRQQEFLHTLARRAANPMTLVRMPALMGVVRASVTTNLGFWDLVYLTVAARRVRSNNIAFYILPGGPSGHYWSIKKETALPLAAMVIAGKKITLPVLPVIAPQADRTTVKVWNASGRRGLAHEVTRYLRQCGYDVIDWGNFDEVQLNTRVIDRIGDIGGAQAVAASLGVAHYHSEPNASALIDVEVILGKNYNGPTTAKGE